MYIYKRLIKIYKYYNRRRKTICNRPLYKEKTRLLTNLKIRVSVIYMHLHC